MRCKICKKKPSEIKEYIMSAKDAGMTPDEFVLQEEGTLNRVTKEFYCSSCYIKIGMPSGTA